MIHHKYLNFSTAIFLLIGSFSWAQFIEVNTELDYRGQIDRKDASLFLEDLEVCIHVLEQRNPPRV